MHHVPVTVGLAVRVQPVLQELLLCAVLQAEQVVHVLLAKQTYREERLFHSDSQAAEAGMAVVLRQGAAWPREEEPPRPGL